MTTEIREAHEADWPQIWPIMRDVCRAGETYAFPRDIDEDAAFDLWMAKPLRTYVAVEGVAVLGTYYLKPNQMGPGAHVANAGYMVGAEARGRGIGRMMCAHSLEEAARLGFRAMQFNLVVGTNTGAIRLWRAMGFDIVGTIPKAFQHPDKGLVDAHVMYRWLG